MSSSTVPGVQAQRNSALLVGLPLAGTYAMVVVAFLAVHNVGSRWLLSEVAVVASAALGAIAAAVHVQRAAGNRIPWICLTIAALTSALTHLLWALGTDSILPLVLLFLSAAAFCAAAAFDFARHSDADKRELALDAGLVLIAAILIVARWSPTAREFFGSTAGSTAGPGLIMAASIAMLCAFLFALINVTALSGSAPTALAGAAGSLALATVPMAFASGQCCAVGNPMALAAVSGWLFLSFAALRSAEPALRPARGWNAHDVLPPMTAILIAAILFDSALRTPLPAALAIVLGLLLALVTARFASLLHAARRHREERAELTLSRALVQVSKALSDSTDLDAILAVVIELSCRLLPTYGAGVELFAADGTTLELKAAGGVSGSMDANNLYSPAAVKVKLRHRGTDLGVLSCVADRPFTGADTELLGALADQAAVAIENARLFQQVEVFSLTDPLTGLANRRHLERDLAREFAAARRGRRLVAVMFDLNGFKEYNDEYGHPAGDEALRVFADTLRAEMRAMNAAARYGGDEFLTLVGDSDLFGAQVFVVRVKQRFSRSIIALGRGQLSVAAGIAEFKPEMKNPEELVEAADRALYESKAATR